MPDQQPQPQGVQPSPLPTTWGCQVVKLTPTGPPPETNGAATPEGTAPQEKCMVVLLAQSPQGSFVFHLDLDVAKRLVMAVGDAVRTAETESQKGLIIPDPGTIAEFEKRLRDRYPGSSN